MEGVIRRKRLKCSNFPVFFFNFAHKKLSDFYYFCTSYHIYNLRFRECNVFCPFVNCSVDCVHGVISVVTRVYVMYDVYSDQ